MGVAMSETSEKVFAGMRRGVFLNHFDKDELEILKRLSTELFITNGGGIAKLIKSEYKYFLIKPTDLFREMFNLEREIIVIFSPYESFEPRTLDAIECAYKKYQQLRIDKICSVVISKDDLIESKLKDLLKSDQEAQIVIPFSYKELLERRDPYFLRNRFKSHFYTRDLFAFEAPLKKELYFFGRNDIVHYIVNRHRSNENSGLFGLRKTGKTSVIFGVRRALEKIDAKSVFIDCQFPAFHQRRWNHALQYVVREISAQLNVEIKLKREDNYTGTNAPLLFEKALLETNKILQGQSILLIFDEIENITFDVASSAHWAKEDDFIYFWQTLRSLFQKHDNLFSYLIVGTNPMCIENSKVGEKDNPIFNQVPCDFLQGFDVPQTREMVRKLGRIMGLKFDELIYGKLTEEEHLF
ncbi:hypothetical protein ACFL5C_01170, partial [Candidatus Omnitrophota bacterium]